MDYCDNCGRQANLHRVTTDGTTKFLCASCARQEKAMNRSRQYMWPDNPWYGL